MPQGLPGDLQKFGSHPGSLVPVVIVGPTAVPAGEDARLSDFGATAGPGSANTVLEFQKSSDGFVGNIVPLSRIELPTPGTVLKTFDSPPKIEGGKSFRVIASQSAPGPFSSEVMGQTTSTDIIDV